jgi:exopolysaccharide production protein ExoQ
MTPPLALGLCLVFCFVALYQEGKLHKDAAWSVWLPTLWMMRCASRSLTLWFHPDLFDTELAEGSLHDQVFFGGLMMLGWAVLWQRRSRVQEILRSNVFLCIFFAYMGLSVFWSEDIASFKRWTKALGDLTMALVVIIEPKPLQVILAVFRRTAYLLIPLSVVLIRYFHALGTRRSKDWAADWWLGVATHKNTLAQLCLVAGIVLLWDAARTWRDSRQVVRLPLVKVRLDILYGVMLAYLLYGDGHSKSTTSFLVLVFASGLFLLLNYQHRRGRPIVPTHFVCGLLLAGLLAHFGMELLFGSSLYEVVLESQGKDATLTGRTDLWHDLWIMGQRHTLLGAGYEGFWNPKNCLQLKEVHFWGPRQAHNGYLEIWLNLGLVGLGLFALVVGHALYSTTPLFQTEFEYGTFRLIVLLITLLHNYSEAGFPRTQHLVWFVFLLVVVNVKSGPATAAEQAPAPSNAARQLWQPKTVQVRERPYAGPPRVRQRRSPQLTPWLRVGKET